jgi:hypothetical protein
LIGNCNPNNKNRLLNVIIFDSRPRVNAEVNRVKGGGYEDCGPGKSY